MSRGADRHWRDRFSIPALPRRGRIRRAGESRGGPYPSPLVSYYLIDAAIWLVAIVGAVTLRHEFDLSKVSVASAVSLGLVGGFMQVLVGRAMNLYSGRYQSGSFDEVRALAVSVFTGTFVMFAGLLVVGRALELPRTTVVIAAPLALLLMFAVRYASRVWVENARKPSDDAVPTLVVGAGTTGEIIVRSMMRDPESPLRPVGLVDDDPLKRHLRLYGVKVRGGTDDISKLAHATGAKVLVIAIARIDAALLRRLTDAGMEAGMRVLAVPTVRQMATGGVSVSDLRSVNIEDLLGRHPVDTRIEEVAGYITGKRVLVTGAGGSIGAELCRQLHRFGPKELIMLDRDESGLLEAQLGVLGHGLLTARDTVLADIRDADKMTQLFMDRKPEVVFHAAALKHLPLLERHPDEAWKTNVLGTLNVVNASRAAGVRTFVNISTDKAANPTSVLGHSKRVAEKITSWAAEETGDRYLSVRFGNVIGSRGSMLPTFESMIASGGPLTVTHPEATRYFMTIPEACQLVVQAGSIGRPSEVLILDMGEPVRILDVARRMIAMSGKDIEIVFTGLREGEKVHEDIMGTGEQLARPLHPQISHTHASPLAPEDLNLDRWLERMREQPRRTDDVSNFFEISNSNNSSGGSDSGTRS